MMNEKWANHPRIQTVGAEGEVKLPENERVSEALKEKRHKRENIPFYQCSLWCSDHRLRPDARLQLPQPDLLMPARPSCF